MQDVLEKLINDFKALSLSDEEYKRLHQYQNKLNELEAFLLKHRDDGEVNCMIQATKAFMRFRKKIVTNPLTDFDYLKGNITHLGWKNEGLKRSKSELFDALDRIEQLHQKNIEVRVYALLGIASADYHHGDHESAITILNKVNSILPLFEHESTDYFQINTHANMHNTYGLAYRAMSGYDKALDHFKKSLTILGYYTKDGSLDGPKLALMNNIGAIFTRQKKWKEALFHFEEYDEFVKSQLQGDETHNYVRVQLGTLLIKMGLCYTHLGQFKLASEKLTTAEQLIDKVEPVYQYLKAELLFSKSILYRKSANYKDAILSAQQSFQYVFSNFRSTNIEDNPNIDELDLNKIQKLIVEPFVAKSAALLACYENEKKDIKLLQVCLNTIDEITIYFNKVRINYSGQASKFSLSYYSKNLYDIGQLACWYLYKDSSKVEYAKKALAYANGSKALVLLEEMHKKWLNKQKVNFEVRQIQSALHSNEVLVEYSVGDKGIFIYKLTKSTINFDYISLKDTTQIEQQITDWLKHHFNVYQPNQFMAYQQEAYTICKKLILPHLKNLANKTTLIIAPDGFLNALPFEALVSKINSIQSYSDINYLIDSYTFAYAFSSYLFYVNRQKEFPKIQNHFLYMSPNFLGNKTLVEHQHIQKEQQALLEKVSLTEMNVHSKPLIPFQNNELDLSLLGDEETILISKAALFQLINQTSKQAPAPLLHNAMLIERLSNMLDEQFSSIALVESEAALVKIFQEESKTADYILISSHAETNEGIVLYDERGKDFTYLTYNMVIDQNLQAQLVVLNMCDSGKGKSVFGEGYLSLGRAFFAAGSLNVIQTLYKVSDKHSANLIAAFFTYVVQHQADFYNALRKAKLLLRNEANSHPKFWAGHVIYGKNGKV